MQFHAITLNSVPEASYLTAENAWRYRAIMRTFYLESQKAHIRLNKTELLALLRADGHFAEYTAEQLEQDLNALCSWRNLVPIQDPHRPTSIAEYKNKQFSYHQEAEQQVGELSRQLEVLREGSDLDNAVRRKEECRRQAAQQQEAVAREQREEQRKQNALDAKERERLQAERRCADQQELLQRNFRELAEQNEELCYPGHPTTLQAVDFQQEQPTFGHFAAQLRKAAELLRRKAEALQQLDRYQQDQDNAAQALRHAQTEWEEARRTVGTMRDALSEAFAALEEPTQAFCLRHGEATALFAQITAYEGLAQEQEMQKILNGALQRLSMPLV